MIHYEYRKGVYQMARIKYIRVSTQEQNTARQEVDKERFDRVYIDCIHAFEFAAVELKK